jgi:hypothetical protein
MEESQWPQGNYKKLVSKKNSNKTKEHNVAQPT